MSEKGPSHFPLNYYQIAFSLGLLEADWMNNLFFKIQRILNLNRLHPLVHHLCNLSEGYFALRTFRHKSYRQLTWPSELSSLRTSCSLAPAANCSDSRTIRSKIVLTIWRMVAAAVLFVVAFFVKCSRKQMTTAWAKARPCKVHTKAKS